MLAMSEAPGSAYYK